MEATSLVNYKYEIEIRRFTSLCCFGLAVRQYFLNSSSICLGLALTSSESVAANSSTVFTQTAPKIRLD